MRQRKINIKNTKTSCPGTYFPSHFHEDTNNKMSFEIMYADQGLAQNERPERHDGANNMQFNLTDCERKFMHFLQETQERNTFIYR